MSEVCAIESVPEVDEDIPRLSSDTLAILSEFYREQEEKCKREESGDISENWVRM